ncbi:MAG: inositol monophosphatase [Acidimicrobiia bacterium]|nr:inositol monophosphatase [Acidimicrobiia bacterium]
MNDLDLARAAAAAAADIIRGWRHRLEGADYKGEVDPVTIADREAEAAIVAAISRSRPDDGILAEEGGAAHSASGRRWVIDPLDGTVNFLHGIPQVAVSIGLEDAHGVAVGVVRDVFRDEEFVACRDGGATLNGSPIRVSACTELRRALVSTGFAYDRQSRAAEYTRPVTAVLEVAQGIRRNGSAALDLAWVSCGRLDGHWEFNLSPWDVAAGFLLVTEAGGVVLGFDGPPDHRGFTAATPAIAAALHGVVAEARHPQGSGPDR